MPPELNYLQLVSFEGGNILLNEDSARKTFANERYRDKKVTFVSIIGPSRSGKSFLVAYMTSKHEIRGRFKSGYDRDTEGIQICEHPMELEDGTFMFFLDTQGTFDLQTELFVADWIMAFSLLIAGIQIINLRINLDGDNLRIVHRAVETANLMKTAASGEKLLFLIRDAACPDMPPAEFLERVWESAKSSSELTGAQNSLRTRYEISCILSPAPSENIRLSSGEATIGTGE
ncbi:unnamed protein product, partial [Mesorhabditis spiculigera]